MTLWLLAGFALVGLSVILALLAWIMSVVMGFKAHVAWGLSNLIVGLCFFPIPQILFSVFKLDERWPLLVISLGGIIPSAIGLVLILVERILSTA